MTETPSDIVLTRAAVELRALVDRLTVAEIARRVGTSGSMISHLAAGRKTPSRKVKDRLVALGIPADGWTVPVVADAPARVTPATNATARRVEREKRAASLAGDVERGSAIALLVESITEIEDLIEEATNGQPRAPVTHIASLMRVKVTALERLAHLRGEDEISTATIRRSRAWQELLAVIERAIVDHPEAARALKEAFAKLT